jgi:hypothetical protein
MHSCYVILEKQYSVESHSLSFAYRIVTRNQLVQVLQMNILNMVQHMRDTFKGTSLLVVCIPLVPNTEDALGLAKNERKLVELREGVRQGVAGGCVSLFLNRVHEGQCQLRLAGLRLLSRGDHSHEINNQDQERCSIEPILPLFIPNVFSAIFVSNEHLAVPVNLHPIIFVRCLFYLPCPIC